MDDHPRNLIFIESDTSSVRVSVNHAEENIYLRSEKLNAGRDTCILKINESLADTIVTRWEQNIFDNNSNMGVVEKWLNGKNCKEKRFIRVVN